MDDSSDQEQEPSSSPYEEEEDEDQNGEGSDAEDREEGSYASANNHEDDEEDGDDGDDDGDDGNNQDEGGEDEEEDEDQDEDDEDEGGGEEQDNHEGSEDDDDANERPDDASYSAEDEKPRADESNGGFDSEGQDNNHGNGQADGADSFPFPTPKLPALPPPGTTADLSAAYHDSSHNPSDGTVSRNPAYAPVTKPLPLGVTIHATPPRLQGKHHCRVVGCPKLLQTNNDGFCRAHFNMYSSKAAFGGNLGEGSGGDVGVEGVEFWVCKCGQRISNKQVRCGTCFKWKGGKREPFALKGEGDGGKKKKMKKKKKKDKTGGSTIEGGKAVKAGKRKKIKSEEIVLTDWTCECGEYLTAKKKRCGKCNRWRGGKRNSITVIKRKKKNSSTLKKEDNGEPWKCECGEMVSAHKARCGKCRHWKGGKKNSKPRRESNDMAREANMEAQQSDPKTEEDWTCACGEVIKGTKSRCGKCHHWRGGKRVMKTPRKRKSEGPKQSASDPFEHEELDWRCSKCDTLMGAKKKRCSECMAWRYKRKKTKTGYTSETALPKLESAQEDSFVQPLAHLPQSQLADITDPKMPIKPKNSINGNLNSINTLNSVNVLNTPSNLNQTNQESLTANTMNPISSELASAASALGINVGPNMSGSVNSSFYENNLHNYASAGLRGNGNFSSQFNSNQLSHNRFNLNQSNFNADHIFGRNSNDHSSSPYGLNSTANASMNPTMSSMNHSMLGANMQSRINMQNRNVMGGRTNMTSQSFNNPTSNSPSSTMNSFSMSANTRSTLNSLFNNSSNLGGMGGMRGNNAWGDDRLMFNNHFDGMGGSGSNSNNFNINNSFPTGGNYDFPDGHGVLNHNGEVNRDDSPFIQI